MLRPLSPSAGPASGASLFAFAVALSSRPLHATVSSFSVSHKSPMQTNDRTITEILRTERQRIADEPFADYQRLLHPDGKALLTESREELVDHIVSALAIEAAATEEILFPLIRDLVSESKTWEEDQVVSSARIKGGNHASNVFESWVERHQELKEQLEKVHELRVAGNYAELDRVVRDLIVVSLVPGRTPPFVDGCPPPHHLSTSLI